MCALEREGLNFFDGAIDNVRIYNRALSTNEVFQLYANEAKTFLTNGLVAYYPFNGNANDASGNGNSGQLGAGMSFTTSRFGVSNGALLFTNVSSYMTTTVKQPASHVFSMCLWFNIPRNSGGGELIQMNSTQTGGDTDKMLQVLPSGILNFYLYPNTPVYLPSPSAVNDGNWHHTAATLSPQGMRLYLDGMLVATNANVIISQGFSGWWRLATGWSGWPTAQGSLGDVRVYNRALSASEVQQLYAFESQSSVGSLKAVELSFSKLILGRSYQLQVSGNLVNWTNQGSAFTATSTNMVYPQYWETANGGRLFFRLQVAP